MKGDIMIISVYEKEKIKRLNKNNIVIEEHYYNPNQRNSPIYIRATDGMILDNFFDKALKQKKYFLNGKCIYCLDDFNSNIHYNICHFNDENEIVKCPNCGNNNKAILMLDGCPYCKSFFNFGINNLNSAKRQKVTRILSPLFFVIFFIILFISFLLICFSNSESNNILFSLLITLGIGFPLFIFMFLCFRIIKVIFRTDHRHDYSVINKNNIWNSTRDEKRFYNDFYRELILYLFSNESVIDFDILEYCKLDFINDDMVTILCVIRTIYFENHIYCKKNKYSFKLKYSDNNVEAVNYKVINCFGCGASISVSEQCCSYCGKINNYNNNWKLIDVLKK